jgi:hypothetical protein
MNDADRVLNLLIHDVRSPLGVAQGYLRLVQEQHLRTPEDVHRALGKTMDALGRIARLCEDAEAFLGGEAHTRARIGVDMLAARVEGRARELGLSLTLTEVGPGAWVSITPDVDRLAAAVMAVLTSAAIPGAMYTALASANGDDRALTFVAAPADQSVSPADLDVDFDPWRGPGLALARACRTIAAAGGRVVTARGPDRALAVAFSLEH